MEDMGMSFDVHASRRVGRGGGDCPDILLSLNGKGSTSQLAVTIGEPVMKQLRWMSGDRVTVAVGRDNDDGLLLIRRVPAENADAYTLTGSGKKRGQCVRSSIKMTPYGGIDRRIFQNGLSSKSGQFVVDGDTLLIDYRTTRGAASKANA